MIPHSPSEVVTLPGVTAFKGEKKKSTAAAKLGHKIALSFLCCYNFHFCLFKKKKKKGSAAAKFT